MKIFEGAELVRIELTHEKDVRRFIRKAECIYRISRETPVRLRNCGEEEG